MTKPSAGNQQLHITIGLVPYGYELTIVNLVTGLKTTEAGDFGGSYDEDALVQKVEEVLFTTMRTLEQKHLRRTQRKESYAPPTN